MVMIVMMLMMMMLMMMMMLPMGSGSDLASFPTFLTIMFVPHPRCGVVRFQSQLLLLAC